MYKVSKPIKFTDTVVFDDDFQISFEISPSPQLLKGLRQMHLESIDIDKKIKESGLTDQLVESKGKIIINLMRLLFGDANTMQVMEYYKNNYVEMLQSIMPYIYEVVIPSLEKMARNTKKKKIRSFKRL